MQCGHLPGIAPEAKMIENGIDVVELNLQLLQKVEELVLYVIEQNKEIQQLKKEVKQQSEKQKNKTKTTRKN